MNLWIYLSAIVFQLTSVDAFKPLPHTKCARTYRKLGCYKTPLSEMLITDRDRKSPHNDGHALDWKKWEESIHSLACRCAKATKKKGFKVFGLQNYGECWSGPDAENTYSRDGRSDKCLMILKNPIPPCNMKDPRECMGEPNVNFMYRLDEDDECAKSPCKNGASCVNIPGGFKCVCPAGFIGNLCDQDEDECMKQSPCKNGGTCVNTIGSFSCKCRHQFQGNLCEQDVDECATGKPCRNAATCLNTVGGFQCKCPAGFKGKLCDTDVDECAAGKPCRNGATCVNTVGGFQCKCPAGFKGKLCDTVVDACRSSPCLNGGSCVREGNGFKCRCVKGFIGMRCDKDFDECLRSPCYNGAQCVNTMGSFKCLCRAGFQGNLCKQDVNECAVEQCQNQGTCVNSIGSFKCQCKPGFTGKLCENQESSCQTMPCKNNGTCIDSHSTKYKCLCAPGYTGMDCEQDIDECALNPCKNGARCVNTNGGFRCVCPAGITGMLCELDVNECQTRICLNGGTCVNTHGSFHCRCKSGYSGRLCENGGCSSQPGKYDLGLIIDGSGSVGNEGFTQTKMWLLKLIGQFSVSASGTHFGMIVYSGEPELICKFSDMRYYFSVSLKLRVLGLEFPDGETRTDKALGMAARDLYSSSGGERKGVPHVLVVITDGNTAHGSEPYKEVLKPLKKHNVHIIAIGVGKGVSTEELLKIAMGRSDRVIQVSEIEDLNAIHLREMIYRIC